MTVIAQRRAPIQRVSQTDCLPGPPTNVSKSGLCVRSLGAVTAIMFLVTACAGAAQPSPVGIEVASGYELAEVACCFDRPTQLAITDDGDWVVGELAGGERDGTGRVLRTPADDAANAVVLHDGLRKPTGVAVAGDALWIMEERRLSVGPLVPFAPLTIIADELAFNGRSEGSLTVTADNTLLFDTSGAKSGSRPIDGSATLWSIADATSIEPQRYEALATGFKHAYAHVMDSDGQIWVVEMSDGRFDGDRAADELVRLVPGADHGWPLCVGNNRPVEEFGASADSCVDVPPSHALFDPGATPTGVVVAPWDPDTLLVALWVQSAIVAIPRAAAVVPHTGTVIVDGIESPQSLAVDGDRVLIVDHETGAVFELTRA